MEKEDNTMLNKYETLNSTVERLGCEIIDLRECNRGPLRLRAEEAQATSAAPVISSAFTPTRVELKSWGCLVEHLWNKDHDG